MNKYVTVAALTNLLLGIVYGAILYWCYAPHEVTCLYCNQHVETSTDIQICFGHQNVLHYECASGMIKMLQQSEGKTMQDFLRTKY